MQDVGITHDVIRPGRTDNQHVNILSDQRFQKRLPLPTRGCGVFISQVDQFNPVSAHQPSDFLREFYWITVPPFGPKPALAAIGTKMRTASRKLQNHRFFAAPVRVMRKIDKLPANAVIVQLRNDCGRARRLWLAVFAKGDAGHARKV